MNKTAVSTLLEKYHAAEIKIASIYGPFSLFGLFEQEAPGRLDLVIAAPWLETNRSGLLRVAEHLPRLSAEEGRLIGRIVAMKPGDDFVHEAERITQDTHNPLYGEDVHGQGIAVSFTNTATPEFPVTRGYVIAASLGMQPSQSVAA